MTLACPLLSGFPTPLLFHLVFPIIENESDWEPQQVSSTGEAQTAKYGILDKISLVLDCSHWR